MTPSPLTTQPSVPDDVESLELALFEPDPAVPLRTAIVKLDRQQSPDELLLTPLLQTDSDCACE